jgi:AcrR family transcriptional regulator
MTRTPKARERLIEAGIDVFGQFGFSGAATRMIAQAAKVNISAIPYYFNGKEGLYHAVVEHICNIVQLQIRSGLERIEERFKSSAVTPQEALGLLQTLMSKMIDFMLGSAQAPRFMRIILREQLDPSAAYEIIYSQIMVPVNTAVAKIVTAVTRVESEREARLRALMIVGQILAFRVAREAIVRVLDLKGYSSQETAEIKKMILEQTQAALNGLA